MRYLALLGVLVAGCGRPATLEDCEFIVERIAHLEIETRNPGHPELVREEVESTKQAIRESTMSQCVGRRITDGALECVRNAKTSQEIVDECFDGWQ
jgi:hypothetical protein